ncbi:MAG TPA: trigger factor [Candidatus Saccharimonadia bacterium]
MEITITSRTESTAEFTVTVGADELRDIKTEVYDHLRLRVKAAGFRPGKAPDMIIERELGFNTVQAEVIDHALQHTYIQAVRQEDLQVVSQPKVSIEKFVPYDELVYTVKVELLATPKLPDFKKLKVKRPAVTVDEAKANQMVEDLRRREAVRLDSEQPAKQGDEMNFDFSGTKDGVKVPGASAKNQTLQLGSGNFIPGFEDELIGLRKGDDKTFGIRFPKEYHESSLADQVVTFEIHVNSVTELVLPEVDDEFAAKVGPFKTAQELTDDIRDQLRTEAEETAAREYEKAVLDKLLADSTYTTPESLVRQQLTRMEAELEQNLAYAGLNFEKYLELTKKSRPEIEAEMRPEAERRVALALVLTEVAQAEKLDVAAAELDAEIDRLKAQYPDAATQKELDNPSTREEVYNHLMASKVIAKLLEYAESK